MSSLWILLLEAGVAVSLLLLMVWATWPKKKKSIEAPVPAASQGEGGPADKEGDNGAR